jgi:hypothetical protein
MVYPKDQHSISIYSSILKDDLKDSKQDKIHLNSILYFRCTEKYLTTNNELINLSEQLFKSNL